MHGKMYSWPQWCFRPEFQANNNIQWLPWTQLCLYLRINPSAPGQLHIQCFFSLGWAMILIQTRTNYVKIWCSNSINSLHSVPLEILKGMGWYTLKHVCDEDWNHPVVDKAARGVIEMPSTVRSITSLSFAHNHSFTCLAFPRKPQCAERGSDVQI